MKHWKRILSAMMVGSVALLGAACADAEDDVGTETDVVEQEDGATDDGLTDDTGTTDETETTETEG